MRPNPASPNLARAINDRMALDLFVRHGSLSAPQLRDLMGLARPSTADLLERLQESGLITQVGESTEKRRGPNAKVYGLVVDYAHVVGVDVRSDETHVSLANLGGETVATARRTISDRQSLAALIRRAIGDAARRAGLEISDLHTIVVGAPGFLDQQTGELLPGYEYPGWDDTLLPELIDLCDVPIALENESDLAGTAELFHGAGIGRTDLAVLWLDRSVGASVILDGALRQGASGGAGEVGKMAVPGAHLPVPGHAAGGLHSLVSADAVRALAAEHELPEGPVAEQVRVACDSRDSASVTFVDALAARIALGTLSLVAVVDPGLIVLSGDVGRAGADPLAERVAQHLATLDATPTEIRPSDLDQSPVLLGAVDTALRIARDDIFGAGGTLWQSPEPQLPESQSEEAEQ